MEISTKSDPLFNEQVLTDEVVQLRIWGTAIVKRLDAARTVHRIIGSAADSWLRLQDERVSRVHAEVIHDSERGRWVLRDRSSKNGIATGHVRYSEITLEPGMEILIGGVAIVAESSRFASTRGFFSRVLGRSAEQAGAVEAAIRSLRMAATHRREIVLAGNDDMVALARSLHRRFFGADRPFVVCDPSRGSSGQETVRSAASYATGLECLEAARGGSVCVKNSPRPPDFEQLRMAMRDPDVRAHLFICIRKPKEAAAFDTTAIVVPPLKQRTSEIGDVVAEYAMDALAELGLPLASFKNADLAWVMENESAQLADIEKATRRLVALRANDGTISRAATLLGMSRMSLRKWIRKRRLPITLVDEEP